MLRLNSAVIGLLGALKDRGLNAHKYEYLKGIDYQSIVNFLTSSFILSEYRDDLKEDLDSLEYFLRLSYLRSCSKFLRFLSGNYEEFLKTFLREYDIYNLKIIMRSILLGGAYPQKLYRFPFSLFYHQGPQFNSIDEVLKFLRKEKEYKNMVEDSFQEYKRRGEYFYFELQMDKLWLDLLTECACRLDKEIFTKLEKWLAVIYILWALRLYHLQGRNKQDILAIIDLNNPYLDREILEAVLDSSSLENALNIIASKYGIQELEDWESSLNNLFFQSEIEGKIEVGVFSLLPVFKFVFQQRYYVENIIYLLNQKSLANV
jgi:vacuolar-type H+-ATPase subunit C/Vma6